MGLSGDEAEAAPGGAAPEVTESGCARALVIVPLLLAVGLQLTISDRAEDPRPWVWFVAAAAAVAAAVGVGAAVRQALGAVSLWALYSVLGRRVMRHRSALSATAFSAFLGLPVLLLAAGWELKYFPVQLGPELILSILYIGVAPTVIGFLARNAGIRRLGASGAMVFYNTLPLYGALLGTLLLGESLSPAYLVSCVLIIGGGIWASRG